MFIISYRTSIGGVLRLRSSSLLWLLSPLPGHTDELSDVDEHGIYTSNTVASQMIGLVDFSGSIIEVSNHDFFSNFFKTTSETRENNFAKLA